MKKIWRFLLLLLFLIPNAQAADPNAHQFGSQGWLVYSDCTGITANGMGCWNGTTLCIGNGTSCAVVTGTSGCTTFSCLAGIPSTIAGYGLTGVVQPYNSYLTGINQDVSTAGSPSWVGATVGASGITATKYPGVAGLMTVYNAATTSTLYMGWMGPATLSRSYAFQFPSTEPTAGQVMAFGVPAGTGDPNGNPISAITWITPMLSTGAGLVEKIAVANFDGGASALSATNPTHQVVYLESAFAATITGYQISCPSSIGGSSGNLTFDVWDLAYSANTLPTVSNTMCGSGTMPTLAYTDSLVKAAWACTTATTVGAGDSLAIKINGYPAGTTTGSWCSITLYGTRN